jgi:hypothetical protein
MAISKIELTIMGIKDISLSPKRVIYSPKKLKNIDNFTNTEKIAPIKGDLCGYNKKQIQYG